MRWSLVLLTVCGWTSAADAQDAAAPAATAFVNVNVVAMASGVVEPGRTLIVRDGRIAEIGAASSVSVPPGARVIDGTDRFLAPGLTDAHVHLETTMPWAPARTDFGDAPLYLAHGVTTVINLAGGPEQLEWRRRIEAGSLLGPTIYTSGPFINEPRVNTPDQVQQEVEAQHRAGYDLFKFHELPRTTTGLSRPAYDRLIETARGVRKPVIGHAPNRLGWRPLLDARQPLAHLGNLSNVYFLPIQQRAELLVLTPVALVVLLFAACSRPARRWVVMSLAATIAAALLLAAVLPGGPLFDSVALRALLTVVGAVIAGLAVLLTVDLIRTWPRLTAMHRAMRMLSTAAAATIAGTLVTFWIPVAWRSTPAGLDRAGKELADAGVRVQTTLVLYETLSAVERSRAINDPMVAFLHPETQRLWRSMSVSQPPGYALHRFARTLTKALHDAGVQLVAGTDAMGVELIVPGASLHRELELLVESGLRPYEALKTATLNAALLLDRPGEFGEIAVGARADLLLLDRNPLDDIGHLRRPTAVMVRGRYVGQEALTAQLAALRGRAE